MDIAPETIALLNATRNALVDYKEQVRTTFIDFVNDNDIDEDTANEFLESLGLEGLETEFPVKVSFLYTAEITVKARSSEKAYELADENLYDMVPSSIRIYSTPAAESDIAYLENYETLDY
jgi:hypothetical protein